MYYRWPAILKMQDSGFVLISSKFFIFLNQTTDKKTRGESFPNIKRFGLNPPTSGPPMQIQSTSRGIGETERLHIKISYDLKLHRIPRTHRLLETRPEQVEKIAQLCRKYLGYPRNKVLVDEKVSKQEIASGGKIRSRSCALGLYPEVEVYERMLESQSRESQCCARQWTRYRRSILERWRNAFRLTSLTVQGVQQPKYYSHIYSCNQHVYPKPMKCQ